MKMRIMYVAPRYHTNQIPIMEGWLKNGTQVMFISQITNEREDHTALRPIILGYSKLFLAFFRIWNRICGCVLPDELFAFSSKKGFPPYFKLRKLVKGFLPDIAILRERSVYTAVAYQICQSFRIPCILYNQSPYWEDGNEKHSQIKKWLSICFPSVRMTPVFGLAGADKCHTSDTYYVPFVMEPHFAIEEKEHFLDDKVQIVCVAGYHERKKLPMLLEATARLKWKYPIHLSIVGEVNAPDQSAYYDQMVQYVKKAGLQENVTLYQNFKREQIFEQYRKSDLFVLPSTRERASISQLEAMSCSLPVICSDTNGAACQIEEGINGYLFRDGSLESLTEKIESAVQDRKRLLQMGQAAYDMVCSDYSFEAYQRNIVAIWSKIKERNERARDC